MLLVRAAQVKFPKLSLPQNFNFITANVMNGIVGSFFLTRTSSSPQFDKNKNKFQQLYKIQYLVTFERSCIIDGGVEGTHTDSLKHKSVYWFNDQVPFFFLPPAGLNSVRSLGSGPISNIHLPKLLYSFQLSAPLLRSPTNTKNLFFSVELGSSRSKSLKASTRENYVLTTE